jgi:hypothetical protein
MMARKKRGTYSKVNIEAEERVYDFMLKCGARVIRPASRALKIKKSTVGYIVDKLEGLYGKWYEGGDRIVDKSKESPELNAEMPNKYGNKIDATKQRNDLREISHRYKKGQLLSDGLRKAFDKSYDEYVEHRGGAGIGNGKLKFSDHASTPKPIERVLDEREVNMDAYDIDYVTISDDFEKDYHRTFIKLVPKTRPVKSVLDLSNDHTQTAEISYRISRQGVEDRERDFKVALIVPDIHIGYRIDEDGNLQPFHDRAALDIVFQVGEHLQPDRVIQIGDLTDLPELSRFKQMPDFQNFMQPVIHESSYVMAKLHSTSTGSENDAYNGDVFIPGNHDERWDDFMINNAPYLYNLKDSEGSPVASLDATLGLSRMGWFVEKGYPNGKAWLNKDFGLSHGGIVGSTPGATVGKMLAKSRVSTGQGHTHRMEQAFDTLFDYGGKSVIEAVNFGCLVREGKDGPPGVKSENNWHSGFGIAYYNDEGDRHVSLIPIRNGRAMIDGKVFYGSGDRYMYHLRNTIGSKVSF